LTSTTLPIAFFSPGVQEKRRNQSDACKVKVESWRLSSGCIGEFRIFVGLFSSHTKPKGKRERETTCFCVCHPQQHFRL
jgi:hypothetical protein